MQAFYRCLISLYPAVYRERFGEEMIEVFRDIQRDSASQNAFTRGVFCLREMRGLLHGALREHARALGARFDLPLPMRRFEMRSGFRFPKATAVLMTIILAGVVVAIERGEAIQRSLPDASPKLGPIQPAHFQFLPWILGMLAFFYAVGSIGWIILFALHRSGVHRLAEVSGEQKQA